MTRQARKKLKWQLQPKLQWEAKLFSSSQVRSLQMAGFLTPSEESECRSAMPLPGRASVCQEPHSTPARFRFLSPGGLWPCLLKLYDHLDVHFAGWSDRFLKGSQETPCLLWMAVSRNQSFRQSWDQTREWLRRWLTGQDPAPQMLGNTAGLTMFSAGKNQAP